MKHLIKLPLLALLCLTAVEITAADSALAGKQSTTPATDAASVGIDFSPSGNSSRGIGRAVSAIARDPIVAARVESSLTSAATQLVAAAFSSITVENPLTGASLEVPAVTAELIAAVVASATDTQIGTAPAGAQINTAVVAGTLTNQINTELPAGISIDASALTAALVALNDNPASLPKAVVALNELINSLDAEQLQALANSPSFVAIRQVILAGNSAIYQ